MDKIYKKLFIVLGSIYDYMPVGANYLAQSLFEEGCQVVFCEQPSCLFLIQHPKYICRLIKNLCSYHIKRDQINIISLTSKILPISHKEYLVKRGLRFLYNIQDKVLDYQIDKFIKVIQAIFENEKIYVIFNDPFSYQVAKKLNSWCIIFRVCDKYEKYPGWIGKEREVIDLMEQAIKGSDILLATSTKIYKDLSKYSSKKLYYLPNGYQELKSIVSTIPRDLNALKKPIIGFVGALNSWLDYDLIKQIALAKPDYSFVLIGPILTPKVKILDNIKNIHLLGYKDRKLLANYYNHFDVAIAPFLINELSNGIDPIKFYEYLSFGLAVITTPIAESKKFQDLIYIADDSFKFVLLIDKALKENNQKLILKRKKYALENSWRYRAQTIIQIVDNV